MQNLKLLLGKDIVPSPNNAKWKHLKQWRKRILLSELPPSAKFVTHVLSYFMDEDLHAFPSQELLAEYTGYSQRTVRRQIKLLKNIGWVDVEEGSGHRKGWRKNYYWGFVPDSNYEIKKKSIRLNIGNFESIKRADIVSKHKDMLPH